MVLLCAGVPPLVTPAHITYAGGLSPENSHQRRIDDVGLRRRVGILTRSLCRGSGSGKVGSPKESLVTYSTSRNAAPQKVQRPNAGDHQRHAS
jgi:hypothetical protein